MADPLQTVQTRSFMCYCYTDYQCCITSLAPISGVNEISPDTGDDDADDTSPQPAASKRSKIQDSEDATLHQGRHSSNGGCCIYTYVACRLGSFRSRASEEWLASCKFWLLWRVDRWCPRFNWIILYGLIEAGWSVVRVAVLGGWPSLSLVCCSGYNLSWSCSHFLRPKAPNRWMPCSMCNLSWANCPSGLAIASNGVEWLSSHQNYPLDSVYDLIDLLRSRKYSTKSHWDELAD